MPNENAIFTDRNPYWLADFRATGFLVYKKTTFEVNWRI